MLEQSKFLVSFDCQNEKFCEELIITYRTEELRPYLIFPRVKLNPNHLHVYHTKRIISELIGMPYSSIEIVDLIRLQWVIKVIAYLKYYSYICISIKNSINNKILKV